MKLVVLLALVPLIAACAPGTYNQNPIYLSEVDKTALADTCGFLVGDSEDLTCREQTFALMMEAREEQRNRSHDLTSLLVEFPLSILADGTIIRLEHKLDEKVYDDEPF